MNQVNEVVIAAIAAAAGSIITVIGKVIVDIKKVDKEPDQADLELKNELARETEKNNKAIQEFTDVVKELKNSIQELKEELGTRIDQIEQRIE